MSSPYSDSYFGADTPEQQLPCPEGEQQPAADVPPVPQQLGQRDGLDTAGMQTFLDKTGEGTYHDWAADQLAYLTTPAPGQPDPLADQVGQAHELLNSVTAKLDAHLSGQLDECQACVDSCHANICGAHHLVMDQVEKTVARCQRKIDEKLVFTLALCYNLLARFGVQYPTDEELQQRLGRAQLDSPSPAPEIVGQTAQTSDLQGQPDVVPSMRSPGQPSPFPVARGFSSPQMPQPAQGDAAMARQGVGEVQCFPVVLCESERDLAPPSQFPPDDDPIFPLSPERESATGEVN